MFSFAARTISRSSRPFVRNLTSYSHSKNSQTNYVPIATVTACAITSGSMYYYFMNRIKNESKSTSESESESTSESPKDDGEPTEVIEVVEVLQPVVEVPTSTSESTSESPKDDGEPTEVIEVVEVLQPVIDVPEAVVSDESALEEEAAKEGAFNEETGEINWDCPCLGGMAHGPCGEEFKSAFSCFVYSKEEPKGIECIDKFKNMQDCFRKYPEVYSEELRDEEAVENEIIQTEKAVDQAVMNNDIIESIDDAIIEANQIKDNAKQLAYDIYGNAQKKIDDFTSDKK